MDIERAQIEFESAARKRWLSARRPKIERLQKETKESHVSTTVADGAAIMRWKTASDWLCRKTEQIQRSQETVNAGGGTYAAQIEAPGLDR